MKYTETPIGRGQLPLAFLMVLLVALGLTHIWKKETSTWRQSGPEPGYSHLSMDRASGAGHIDVLKWWAASGLEVRYSDNVMDLAKNTQILDWWITSGLRLKYSEEALDHASRNGEMDILGVERNKVWGHVAQGPA